VTITGVFVNEDRARIAVVIDDYPIVVYDVTDTSAGREITIVTHDWVSMFGADPGVPVRDGIGPLPVGVDLPGWQQPRRIVRRGGVTLDHDYLEQCAGRERGRHPPTCG
jgi:hypothetical protein